LEPRICLDGTGFRFLDSFEAGLGSHWRIPELEGDGSVSITDEVSVNTGGHSLRFHSLAEHPGDDLNEAILTLNLTGTTRPLLTFHQLEGFLNAPGEDRNDPLDDVHVVDPSSSTRVAGARGDGLSISNNGVLWFKLRDVTYVPDADYGSGDESALACTINRAGDGLWLLHEYDLASEITRLNAAFPSAHLELNDSVQIKFSQYGDSRFPTSGWAIDKVEVTDRPRRFDLSLERGVFHRLSLPGEADSDFQYRLGMFGTIDATTPILLSVHGGDRVIDGYSHAWSKYFALPDTPPENVIVVAPYFTIGGGYDAYNRLSWGDRKDGRTADGVTIELVEHVIAILESALGGSHHHPVYLYGHSGGGQFAERFLLAHPDFVDAAIVSSPAFRTALDPETPFPYGLGPNPGQPAPAGIDLVANVDDYLSSRIMFWVGDQDKAPDEWMNNTGLARKMGYSRLHRTLNMYEMVYDAALDRVPFTNDFEYEVYVAEGRGHGGKSMSDFAAFRDFLFRPSIEQPPIRLHPLVVYTPSLGNSRAALPQSMDTIAPGSEFYLEIWLEAPLDSAIRQGSVEIVYDTDLVDALAFDIDHGAFFSQPSATVDDRAGRIRSFGGRTNLLNAGEDRYALFGRIHFQAGATLNPIPSQLAIAIAPGVTPFDTQYGEMAAVRYLPVPHVEIQSSTGVSGSVYQDTNGNGLFDTNEPGVRGAEVRLQSSTDSRIWEPAQVYAAILADSFEQETVVSWESPWMNATAAGSEVWGNNVAAIAPDPNDLDHKFFGWCDITSSGGVQWNTLWQDESSELRVAFPAPTEYASVHVYGGDEPGRARVEAFNAAGGLLEAIVTPELRAGGYHIVEIRRPAAEIAYVIATSAADSPPVRLGSIASLAHPAITTNEFGHYALGQLDQLYGLDSREYRVLMGMPRGWEATAPRNGRLSVLLEEGHAVQGPDFGIVPFGHGIRPDLAASSLSVTARNLFLNAGRTTVQYTVANNTFVDSDAFDIQFYLSEDPLIDPDDPRDVLIPLAPSAGGFDALRIGSGLSGFREISGSVELLAPAADPFRSTNHYYLGMVMDAGGEIGEQNESNNRNQGLTIDRIDVTYAVPAAFPFAEDWETGDFSEHWEVIPGDGTGRIEVTSDHGPWQGSSHVVLDHDQPYGNESSNQLVLHIDLSSESQVLLGAANREWNDGDDNQDLIDYGLDTLRDTVRVARLTDTGSTNHYEQRWYEMGCASCYLVEDTLIRFQQRGEAMVPHDGMAFDDIQVVPALAELVGRSLTVSQENLQLAAGAVQASFTIANLTPMPADDVGVRFYLSEDRWIDPAHDKLLTLHPDDPHFRDSVGGAELRVTSLLGHAEHTGMVRLVVPAIDPFAGGNHYYLGMVVDADRRVEELDDGNNANQGIGVDTTDVTYITPVRPPLFEGWESAAFADYWEAIPGVAGQVEIVGDGGPFEGTRHVVMDGDRAGDINTLNQLILHVDLSGLTGLELSWANREWDDDDDVGLDKISISTDGGETWRNIRHLVHTNSTNGYVWRTCDLDSLGITYTPETRIRFQQQTNGAVPADGMAFDSIHLGPEARGPQVVRHAPFGRVAPGVRDVEFTFNEPMKRDTFSREDVTSFTGPGDRDLIGLLTSFHWKDEYTLVVRTPPLVESGLYAMVIGPGVADASPSLNLMDQDADGRKAETPGDQYRASFLVVRPLHFADMETDPGWTLDRGTPPFQWQRGAPGGGGSQVPGPTAAVSGHSVLGYNLNGNYANNMSAEFATTPAINATGYEHLAVSFHQWLSVDAAPGDRATIQVSHDGIAWTTVYENPEQPLFAREWTYRTVDISAVADDQPTVFLRWGMGPTNATAAYAGWYLDDVMVSGIAIDASLPTAEVTDDEGDAHDRRVDFGTLDALSETRSHTVTIANTGGSALTIRGIELSDPANFTLTWDGDGAAPAWIAAGSRRVATITYAPLAAAAHPATLTMDTDDPSERDAHITIDLAGSGEVPVEYGWVRTLGASRFDAARTIATDRNGNMFTGGFFEATVDFDPHPLRQVLRTAVGSRDAFVSKYSPEGQHLWTWTAGGAQADETFGVAVGSDGSVLVTGEFRQTVDFNAAGLSDLQSANGFNDVFVTKLSADGSYLWTRVFGGTSADTGNGIAVDLRDHVHVAGSFTKTVDFDPRTAGGERTSIGKSDVYLVEYLPDGTFAGVRTIGGVGTDLASGLAVDDASDLVVTGLFSLTVDFDPGAASDVHHSAGLYDAFITRLNADGSYAWTRTMGGTGDDETGDVALDRNGNVYFTGHFQGTVTFDPVGQTDVFTSLGGSDVFVSRWNRNGTYGWTRVMAGTATGYGRGLAVGDGDALMAVGSFDGTTDFDPQGQHRTFTSRGKFDVFVTRYSLGGVYRDTHVLGGTGNDHAMDVAAGSVYMAGYFEDSADFDPTGGVDSQVSHGSADIFAGRLLESRSLEFTIDGQLWNDLNGDGVRTDNEPVLPGWILFLDADLDGVLDPNERSTVSGADGRYEFRDLSPGLWNVAQVRRSNWSPSNPHAEAHTILLGPRDVRHAVDFGNYEPMIGDWVWNDLDGDGYQDAGEPGLAGVEVRLLTRLPDDSFAQLQAVTTGDDGQYAFRGLVPGEYWVEYVRPDGYLFSRADQRDADDKDSDADPSTGRTGVISLAVGQNARHYDAGLWREGSLAVIGDRVWNDANGNGLQDTAEAGVPDVNVSLYIPGAKGLESEFVASTLTDSNGRYAFVGVRPGQYFLRFDLLVGQTLTVSNVGRDDKRDSDPLPSTQVTSVFSVDKGVLDLSWDAGVLNRDFGDAPDPSYPTTAVKNGAYHQVGGRFLGAGVDADEDGQSDPRALGDDRADRGDDEDGIVFVSALVPDSACVIEVTASAPGRLDAWIDFGGDGSWSDADDRIFDHQDVAAGLNELTFVVPETAELGATFARFRYSKSGVASFTGPAPDGEVEDYEVVIEALDWGDAPDVSTRPLVTKLVSFTPAASEQYGASVAMDGRWAMVGAPQAETGSVYVYYWDGAWVPFEQLTPSDGEDGDGFGSSVAVSGDWAIIGSKLRDEGDVSEVGAAYVFHWDGTSWTQSQRLSGAMQRRAQFGGSIDLVGDQAIIGAAGGESAYVYRRDGAAWSEVQRLSASDGLEFDQFGNSVSISGTWAVVGAPGHSVGDVDYAGATYVFEWDGTQWLERQKITASTPHIRGSIGWSTSLFGDRAVITEPGRAAHVFVLDAGVWSEQQQLEMPGDGFFGASVELAGNQVVVGGDSDVYVFGWDGLQWRPIEQIAVDIAPDPFRGSGLQVAVDNTEVLVGAFWDDHLGLLDSGAAYMVRRGSPAESDYATLYVNNGARHSFDPGMYLGVKVDIESNGIPEDFADGDDRHHGADEDGVVLSRLVRNSTSYVEVTASAAGYLNAWIDFNRNGSWDDDGDQIFAGQALLPGPNTLAFHVPDTAVDDLKFPTFGRFRYSRVELLGYDGPAPDGEVEDYAVWIVPDTDSDGVADEIEDAAPYRGDGNLDGVLDSGQSHVASLGYGENGYVTIIAPESSTLDDLHRMPDHRFGELPAGMNFILGLFGFRVAQVTPGDAVTVTMVLHDSWALNAYYLYGQASDLRTRWYPFILNGGTGAIFKGTAVDLKLVDGLRGDSDVHADGIVTVRGGPAINEHPRPWQNPVLSVNVNDDGFISPIDALLIINVLNSGGSRALTVPPVPPDLPLHYYDVSGDNLISPIDALLVINDLNAHGTHGILPGDGSGEGESDSGGPELSLAGSDMAAIRTWNVARSAAQCKPADPESSGGVKTAADRRHPTVPSTAQALVMTDRLGTGTPTNSPRRAALPDEFAHDADLDEILGELVHDVAEQWRHWW
jgi:hypothetical protein